MLSRLTLRAAARAMHRRESARYVAPASAPIDPFARCDHPRPCLRRECSCLALSTSPRARAYRAGTDALLTRSCAPTLDRPSPFPTAEELLDEEIQAEEEGGLGMEPGPARLRARAEELRCEADCMDDASDALREAHARRLRRVLESLEDASCRKRREADELERRAMALREELNG